MQRPDSVSAAAAVLPMVIAMKASSVKMANAKVVVMPIARL